MEAETLRKELHPLEVKVLRRFSVGEELAGERLADELGYNPGQANQAFSWLSTKGLIGEKSRVTTTAYELTELGADYRENGTPEERMLRLLQAAGPKRLPDIARELSLENKDVGSAYGQLAKQGVLAMDGEKRVMVNDPSGGESVAVVRKLLDRVSDGTALAEEELSPAERKVIAGISKKRGAAGSVFKVVERDRVTYALTSAAKPVQELLEAEGVTGEEIGALTPEVLASGEWRERGFRSYNVNSPPARVPLGRRNAYAEFLQSTKDKLASLGFEEFDGPLVETEFWNSDALFMPQFHSARDIHDVYYIKEPNHAKQIERPYIDNVAAVHENGWETGSKGWQYTFDRDFTRRLILRSQGTVLSAKTLPKAKVPGKYFGVVRCFRYDQVDATHLADFYQTEGIVLSEEVNLRTLLGLLRMFAVEVAGAKDVKYVPGYFPFTEPSVEVHIKHPVLGWFELGGSGIFRPEVTQPLGIHVPVLAWGLGIDRMAMMHLGIDDMRELFTHDIESARLRRRS
jgi:phenylalanyl-tRNA synthetase alpha chain